MKFGWGLLWCDFGSIPEIQLLPRSGADLRDCLETWASCTSWEFKDHWEYLDHISSNYWNVCELHCEECDFKSRHKTNINEHKYKKHKSVNLDNYHLRCSIPTLYSAVHWDYLDHISSDYWNFCEECDFKSRHKEI